MLIFIKNKNLFFGVILVLPFFLFSLFPSTFATHKPNKTSIRNLYSPPNLKNIFGTDELGRDIYSRIVHGSRSTLFSSMLIIIIATFVGSTLGLFAGYYGGFREKIILSIVDLVLSFPALVLALVVCASLGPGLKSAIIASASVWWPVYARLIHSITVKVKKLQYIEAAQVMGFSDLRILIKHIIPNCLSSLIVRMSLDLGLAILLLTSLSFVGLGASAPDPEWGSMVAWGRLYLLTEWWIGGFPTIVISIVVIGVMLIGDGLNDLFNVHLQNIE